MSETTKEINKITGTIINISVKLIVYALVILLLYEGVTKGYQFGYEVFHTTAVEAAPGTEKTVVIEKGASAADVARLLKRTGLIKDELVFVIQAKFYEYDLNPGTYTLNTSMNSREMLEIINEVLEEEDKKP